MKKFRIFIFIVFIFLISINTVNALNIDNYSMLLADCTVLDAELNNWLKNAFKFVQYAGVGLAVILTAVDFVQVVMGAKDDELKSAFNRTIKRLLAVVLLLLTGVIVSFVIDIIAPVSEITIPNCVENV